MTGSVLVFERAQPDLQAGDDGRAVAQIALGDAQVLELIVQLAAQPGPALRRAHGSLAWLVFVIGLFYGVGGGVGRVEEGQLRHSMASGPVG